MAAVGLETVTDLDGQLAGRRQNQGLRPIRLRFAVLLCQAVQDGQRKRRRLSGSGLRAAQNVATFHGCWNRLLLDWRGGVVLFFLQGALERFQKLEVFKSIQRWFS